MLAVGLAGLGGLGLMAQRQLATFDRELAAAPLAGARLTEGAMAVERDGKVVRAGHRHDPVKVGDRGTYVSNLRQIPPGPYVAWVWVRPAPDAPAIVQAARTPQGAWLPAAAEAWAPGLPKAP